ncbi:MAG: chemotaxis response regulator protein-glutamate methylesterase [Desulfuromonadales bacterium]|nr:chemotaxis response regulator protein-glutamate methylesterase [Desulfuromonadales bacterium]
MSNKKIKVLVVDDSAVVRQSLSEIINNEPDMILIGTAADPIIAATKIAKERPDVITLDVEMPRMDGLTFLQKIMSQHPIPVVICSSLTEKGAATTLKALQLGAVEIVNKPRSGARQFFEESKIRICDAIRAASIARLRKLTDFSLNVEPKLTADVILSRRPVSTESLDTTQKVIVVGASTGGTEALRIFLQALPYDAPGVIIVQHMPEHFTAAFAKRLDGICKVTVKEAQENDTVIQGRALIAPGNQHILLKRSGARYYVSLKDGPLVNRHRPSVDVLFRSTARYVGSNAVGLILTGMGDDGARGMLEMKQAGAYNFAQDEASCVVFGMPNEAIKHGAVDKIVPLEACAKAVLRAAGAVVR